MLCSHFKGETWLVLSRMKEVYMWKVFTSGGALRESWLKQVSLSMVETISRGNFVSANVVSLLKTASPFVPEELEKNDNP